MPSNGGFVVLFKTSVRRFFYWIKMKNTIAITTDFGDNFASAQIRAVLASLGFSGNIIENHSVTAYSIIEGAFQILTLSKFTPPGAIHLGVVDPGVGSDRKGLIIKTNNYYFVGPDNGLLFPAATNDKIKSVYQIQESKINGKISNTFHGRDIFVKIAANLAKGKTPENLEVKKITPQIISKIEFKNGQVLHIDHYGNVKVYCEENFNIGQILRIINSEGVLNIPIVKTFSDVLPAKPLALLGSSDTLELAVNMGNIQHLLGVKIGDIIRLEFSNKHE